MMTQRQLKTIRRLAELAVRHDLDNPVGRAAAYINYSANRHKSSDWYEDAKQARRLTQEEMELRIMMRFKPSTCQKWLNQLRIGMSIKVWNSYDRVRTFTYGQKWEAHLEPIHIPDHRKLYLIIVEVMKLEIAIAEYQQNIQRY
jgi:hypothetical protein